MQCDLGPVILNVVEVREHGGYIQHSGGHSAWLLTQVLTHIRHMLHHIEPSPRPHIWLFRARKIV